MDKKNHPSVAVMATGSFIGMERLLPVLTFFSGFAALIYESLWLRSFGLIFGNTTNAITVILATYMGGIALGSFLVGRVRINNPLKTYAFVELLIAISAIGAFFLLKLMPEFWGNFMSNRILPDYLEMLFRILLAGLIILIPTLAMGTTVPLLLQILSRQVSPHKVLSRLYYMNTLGGAAGVLLATFLLFPALGLSKTYSIAVLINLVISGLSLVLVFYKKLPIPDNKLGNTFDPLKSIKVPGTFILLATIVGATSFCLEILWSRSFAIVIGSSIYSFNLMLFSFLLGLVVGTWLYEKYWEKIKNPNRLLIWLLLVLGVGTLLSVVAIGRLPLLYYSLMDFLPLSFGIYQLVGFLLCFFVMIILTSIFGFIFPLLLRLVAQNSDDPGKSRQITSKLYAWNTLGTLIGAVLTGFVIIPVYGLQNGYVIAASLPLILGIIILGIYKKWNITTRICYTLVVVAGIVILSITWRPWNLLVVTSGLYKYGLQQKKGTRSSGEALLKSYKNTRQLVYYKEGVEGIVAVTNTEGLGLYLSVNGKTDASMEDQVTQKMLAHVPLALNSDSKNALVIGWGSGCTSGTAGLYPLESVVTVEIEPEVYNSNFLFNSINNKIYNDPRFKIIFKDGRNVLLTTSDLFDVIISEPSNPWITGVSNLFTKEFYESGLARLSDHGVFCQWFHIYDMPLEVMQSQVRTFCSVFPDAMLWIVPPQHIRQDGSASMLNGDVLLVGGRNPLKIDLNRLNQLFENPVIKQDFISCGIDDVASFVSNAILDRNGLIRFCGNAPLNTDDYPFIEFSAPRGLYHNSTDLRKQVNFIYDAIQKADSAVLPIIIDVQELLALGNLKNLSEIYVHFGNLFMQKNLLFRAEMAYKKAFRIEPNSSNASTIVNFWLKNNQYDQVIAWCQKTLELDRKNMHSLEQLGLIYSKKGNNEMAKKVYTEMMVQFPNDEKGSFNLGMIFYKEKKFREAEIYLNQALSINSDLQQAKLLLKYIKD